MTTSTVTLAPGTTSTTGGPGTGVSAELDELQASFDLARTLDTTMGPESRGGAVRSIIERANTGDIRAWLSHVRSAAGCTNPIRLQGTLDHIDSATGTVLSRQSTHDMPDGVIYKSCGNRRHSVCPHCAELYRADAYQLIRAGMTGGKGVDTAVAGRPAVFVTFTAPSFGPVHGPRQTKTGQPAPCRPRRTPELCPHGIDLRCTRIHRKDEHINGTPLCLDCYNYPAQVVWNHLAGELWRRTIGVALRRYFDRLTARLDTIAVKANCCKVAEYQTRGVLHYHAVFRLDGIDPDTGAYIAPPAELDTIDLTDAIRYAVKGTAFTTEAHPDHPDGWRIGWGTQLDIHPIQLRGDAEITDSLVAGYLAKYLTKSTEAAGHVSRRLNSDTIDLYANENGTHAERLVWAAWWLGRVPEWHKLRRWAHMLGSGGHPLTKSRGYSITFKVLRDRRIIWRRTVEADPAADTDNDTTLIVGTLSYAGTGWRTLGDAMLANTSAAMARERARIAREELAEQYALSQ